MEVVISIVVIGSGMGEGWGMKWLQESQGWIGDGLQCPVCPHGVGGCILWGSQAPAWKSLELEIDAEINCRSERECGNWAGPGKNHPQSSDTFFPFVLHFLCSYSSMYYNLPSLCHFVRHPTMLTRRLSIAYAYAHQSVSRLTYRVLVPWTWDLL